MGGIAAREHSRDPFDQPTSCRMFFSLDSALEFLVSGFQTSRIRDNWLAMCSTKAEIDLLPASESHIGQLSLLNATIAM